MIETKTFTGKKLDELISICHSLGVSVNDYLIAEMVLIKKTNKVITAADIRNKLSNYHEGSLGNYSTAFSVKVNKRICDVNFLAKEISRQKKR